MTEQSPPAGTPSRSSPSQPEPRHGVSDQPYDLYSGVGRWVDPDKYFTADERELILQLAAQLPLACWSASGKDHGFAIKVWTPGAEKLYGIAKYEALGANYLDLFVDRAERDQAEQDHQTVERTGLPYRNIALDKVRDPESAIPQSRIFLTEGIALKYPPDRIVTQAEFTIDITKVDASAQDGLTWLMKVRDSKLWEELSGLAKEWVGDTRKLLSEDFDLTTFVREKLDALCIAGSTEDRELLPVVSSAAAVLFWEEESGYGDPLRISVGQNDRWIATLRETLAKIGTSRGDVAILPPDGGWEILRTELNSRGYSVGSPAGIGSGLTFVVLPLRHRLYDGMVILGIDDPEAGLPQAPNQLSKLRMITAWANLLGEFFSTSLELWVELAHRLLSEPEMIKVRESLARDMSMSAFSHDLRKLSYTIEAITDQLFTDIKRHRGDATLSGHCVRLMGISNEAKDLVAMIHDPIGECDLQDVVLTSIFDLSAGSPKPVRILSSEQVTVRASPAQVRRMLRELCRNAEHYSPWSAIEFMVSSQPRTETTGPTGEVLVRLEQPVTPQEIRSSDRALSGEIHIGGGLHTLSESLKSIGGWVTTSANDGYLEFRLRFQRADT